MDRTGKRVLDFTIGDRSETTAKQLLENIRKIKVETYHTDYWKAYEGILPPKRQVQSRAEAYRIEGLNNKIRHYLARFKRKTNKKEVISGHFKGVNLFLCVLIYVNINLFRISNVPLQIEP